MCPSRGRGTGAKATNVLAGLNHDLFLISTAVIARPDKLQVTGLRTTVWTAFLSGKRSNRVLTTPVSSHRGCALPPLIADRPI
jgi:hypothetical protein